MSEISPKRWRDIAIALINRVHDQQVTLRADELEKAKDVKSPAMFVGENGRATIKIWPDETKIDFTGQNGE